MMRLANLACAAFAAGALFAHGALAQQANVTGPELLSGTADKRLQDVARDAKSDGKKLVISAPEYWHEMILEQIRKGGGGDVQVELRDSFAETVSVRAEDTAPAPAPEPTPAPEPEPIAAPAPKPEPPPVVPRAIPRQTPASAAKPPAPRPAATPAPASAPKPTPPPAPATVQATPAAPAPAPQPAATPAATPAPAAGAQGASPVSQPQAGTVATPPPAPARDAAPAAAPRSTSDAEVATIKRRLEQNLNAGNTVNAVLRQTQLEPGDVIYVEGPVRAVLRRESLRNKLYWLEGDLNLGRVELKELAGDRYQVVERIRIDATPRLRAARATQTALFTAADPEGAAEREQLERRYNGGNRITGTLRPDGLRQKDILYLGDKLVVVVRLDGLNLERYWLVGDINLGRTELIKDGANKYKVLADIR